MIWSIIAVIVSGFIIITFLVPAIAAVLVIAEMAVSVSEERREKAEKAAIYRFEREAAGPFCAWEGYRKAA